MLDMNSKKTFSKFYMYTAVSFQVKMYINTENFKQSQQTDPLILFF